MLSRRLSRRLSRQAPRRCDALSLVELLTAVSVAAIILALGVPSMAHWMHAVEVRNSASDLVAVLQLARSEAITRNQEMRVTLGDAQGHTVWKLGCVTVTASCPHNLRTKEVATRPARWGASPSTGSPALTAPLAAGLRMPASVTFNAYGAAPAIGSGSEVNRIDVLHAADTTVQRLVVMLSASGMVRVCDPMAAAGEPQSCN